MANQLSVRRPTSLSLESRESRIMNARRVLATSTPAADATRAADRLCGQFASLKAHNPREFVFAVAATLAKYPPEVVAECCDPQHGLARTVEFISVKSIVEWCDAEVALYRKVAAGLIKPPATRTELPDNPMMAEHANSLFAEFGAVLRQRLADNYHALTEKIWGKPKPWDGSISSELRAKMEGK